MGKLNFQKKVAWEDLHAIASSDKCTKGARKTDSTATGALLGGVRNHLQFQLLTFLLVFFQSRPAPSSCSKGCQKFVA